MARELTFRTTVSLSIWDGDETELDLVIKYEVEADELYIRSILLISNSQQLAVPSWLDRLIRQDEALAKSVISEANEREAA